MAVAAAKGAVEASLAHDSSAIIVFADSTALPSFVGAYRPNFPIVTFCPNSKMARQLILTRGIYPVVGLQGITDIQEKIKVAIKETERMGYTSKGDSVVIVYVDENSANFKISKAT